MKEKNIEPGYTVKDALEIIEGIVGEPKSKTVIFHFIKTKLRNGEHYRKNGDGTNNVIILESGMNLMKEWFKIKYGKISNDMSFTPATAGV